MGKKLFAPHYDQAFKRMVIEEYLSTGCSKMSLLRKYGIEFKSAIQTWMRVLGYSDFSREVIRKPTFGSITFTSVPQKITSTSSQDSKVLQKKIDELERKLQDEKLRSEAYLRIIEKAEKELNIPIRKKPFTK